MLVIGQIIQRFIIEPIQEQPKAIGEVDYHLILIGDMMNTDQTIARAAAN